MTLLQAQTETIKNLTNTIQILSQNQGSNSQTLSQPEVVFEPEEQDLEIGYEVVDLGELESLVDVDMPEEVDVTQL